MLAHHIQKSIVYKLAFADALRFSELKPDGIESKLFDYHLKKVISANYVHKNEDGLYQLTPQGKMAGQRALKNSQALIDQAYPILVLAIRRKEDKAWLLCRRKSHPLIGRVGFMRSLPEAGKNVVESASQTCLELSGIKANFRVLGSGFVTVYDQQELESYTNYTFLASDDAEGELLQNDPLNEFYWAQDPDFTDENMLPNTKMLGNLHKANELFFVEKTFNI